MDLHCKNHREDVNTGFFGVNYTGMVVGLEFQLVPRRFTEADIEGLNLVVHILTFKF